jgi:hypothetical protein
MPTEAGLYLYTPSQLVPGVPAIYVIRLEELPPGDTNDVLNTNLFDGRWIGPLPTVNTATLKTWWEK